MNYNQLKPLKILLIKNRQKLKLLKDVENYVENKNLQFIHKKFTS